MDLQLYRQFCAIAYAKAGMALGDHKMPLMESRVGSRCRALGIATEAAYLRYLEADLTGDELIHFLNALTTNFTQFYREPEHLRVLAVAAKGWADESQGRLRFWSAASSTGEEPYSMAMVLLSALEGRAIDFRILATDLSTRVLGDARRGVYDEERIGPIPRLEQSRFLEKAGKSSDGKTLYSIAPVVRERVVFKRLNLSVTPFPMTGPIDAVLCRNVMIYFDVVVRQRLVDQITRLLKPGGLLMIGHAETLTGLQTRLVSVQPSIYRKDHL